MRSLESATVSCRLKLILKEKGITQESVAEGIGARISQINPIANGKQLPRVDRAVKIAEFVGVPVEEIWPLWKPAA
jgi:transcriptional regulator with XRE-family HTH domain